MDGFQIAIQHFGTPANMARALGVSKQRVNNWRTRRVPVEFAAQIERLSGGKVRARDIRPDIAELFAA